MDPFIAQLATLCREHVTRSKWVFVPSHAIGHTLGERIALGGTNWLNLRFVTPLDIALRMGAPFLVERGIDPSEEGLGPALMMRLLLALPASTPEDSGAAGSGLAGSGEAGSASALAGFGAAGPCGGYFRPLAEQPTLAQALWTTIRELRMAGVKPADVGADAFESPAKHAEICALLESYGRFLAGNRRADMAAVYEEAVRHPDWCPIQPQDCWTELPDVVWSPLQRRLIDAMPGERIAPKALSLPGTQVPRRLAGGTVERIAPDGAVNPMSFLLAPHELSRQAPQGADTSTSPVARGTDARRTSHVAREHVARRPSDVEHVARSTQHVARGVGLFHAGGSEAEIEEVVRRILAAGIPLDQVEIACASNDHVTLVWEKALRHEWPVTLGPGIPATATRPGRALLGFCDWIETDFSASHLRHLLQSGDMDFAGERAQRVSHASGAGSQGPRERAWRGVPGGETPRHGDDEGFTAGQAARTIARAEAGWGRETYRLSLGALRKAHDSRANDPDLADDERKAAVEKAELTGRIKNWVTGLIAGIPKASADNTVPLQAVVTAAEHYVERSAARVSKLDHVSGNALREQVSELRALGDFRCTLGAALRFIRERVQSLNVAPDRPRPGHLYACSLAHAGYSGRPHLFVVGLEEGRVFPVASEDPVLLDAERGAISPALKLSTDRIDEAVYAVLSRLAARPASHITFSYSCRDTREFRETYASWLMLQAFRLQQGDASLSYPQMKDMLGAPVSVVPRKREASATGAGWWLRSVVSTGDEGREPVESTFIQVAAGRKAHEHRTSDAFTEYDGHVPAAGPVLDPCASDRSFSVTDLETAASCPFRFLLKRGLGLRPVDERERDKDVWLDPLTRGSALHDIYAELHRRCRDAKRRPDLKQDGAWLRELAQGRLASLQEEMPASTGEVFDRESRAFLEDVDLFLAGECEAGDGEPIGFEVSFGRPLGGNKRSGDQEITGQKEEKSPELLNSCEDPLAREESVEIDLGGGLVFRIAGRIDRIDQVGTSEFRIVDYKTGGFWRDNWKGVFNRGRRLQHALYGIAGVELLRAKYKQPKITEGVYYFSTHKGGRRHHPIKAPTQAQTAKVLSDLRDLIVGGAFVHAPDEEACKFCDYTAACDTSAKEHAKGKLEDRKLAAYGRLAEHV